MITIGTYNVFNVFLIAMKNFSLLLIAFCTGVLAYAQKVYFIYLQSDNYTPFYVKMGDKVYSSSPAGYLILSKLRDSTYTFSIGTPAAGSSESRFSITINGNDKGYILKDVGTGLNLFDLQTMTLQGPLTASIATASTTKKTDAFTTILSEAANDASLLEIPAAVKEEKKTPPEKTSPEKKEIITINQPAVRVAMTTDKRDSIAITENKPPLQEPPTSIAEMPKTTTSSENTAPAKVDTFTTNKESSSLQTPQPTPVEQVNYKRSIVTRRAESSTTEGFGLVFLDNQDGVIDTIRLLIPNPKNFTSQQETGLKKEEATPTTSAALKKNSACQAVASDNDFFRLRRDMATKNTDNNMIDEARKVFRKKCFTTEQIRNLSTLFLTAEGKYNFFDAAYRYTSDLDQFPTLETELKNDNYIKRFKALVGQ
ncbi:MAG: hypothetical protein ICV84_06085 [Flavisolibacter sp.]|nr:hypothetical protein [Flavisolibacter sp.]